MRALLIAALVALMAPVAIVSPLSAETLDDDAEVVSSYARAKRLMGAGDWLEASRVLLELIGTHPSSPNIDLFIFNRAKAELYVGDFADAQAGFIHYLERFPSRRAAPHAHYFLGNTYYLQGQLDLAAREYITAYGLSNDPRLSRLCITSLREAIETATSATLTAADFDGIAKTRACALIDSLLPMLSTKSNQQSLRSLSDYCGRSYQAPGGRSSSRGLEIAMVLPLSGEYQSFGEEIYHGAVIAAEQYREQTGSEIRLVSYDTKGDPVSTARIIKELIDTPTDAVVGPLTSEAAAVSSAVLSCGTLPLVAPAATQAGLTLLSESSFQLSPNIEMQGIRMAEYAVRELGADSAAVITPTGVDHLTMARAFERRFKELGGTIVAVEYYRPRDKDFGKQIRDLKAHMLGMHPDSTFFINELGDTLDADGLPVDLDCLFLPGDPSQLRQLLPQIDFYNLNAAYLGSDGWGDEDVFKLGDQVTKRAVFPSPFLTRRSSEAFVKFSAEYDRRYGERPQRLASLGFDAVTLIAEAARRGANDRSELVKELALTASYEGAAARVTFGAHRENIELPLYRIIAGAPVPLEELQPETQPDSATGQEVDTTRSGDSESY